MKKKTQNALKLLLGLFGLVAIVLIALLIPSSSTLFQGELSSDPLETTNQCNSLTIKTIPQVLTPNKSATIIIETTPPEWKGPFTVSASSGTFSDPSGKSGSLFITEEKILSFSGGDALSIITIQSANSEKCVDSVKIEETVLLACESLIISTYPEPVLPNESLEITISPSPENWNGTYLIQAESGKLTLGDSDPSAQGISTSTLITSQNKIIYNGGKEGESIVISGIGEGNEGCSGKVVIGTE